MKDRATWRMLSHINSLDLSIHNEASLFFVKQVRPFLQICPLMYPYHNNINEIYQTLDNSVINYCDFSGTYKFEAQYHIFHKHTGSYLTSVPFKYKSDVQQIFFLGSYVDDQISIVALISNLTTFFAAFGIFCNFCRKQFKGKGTQHKCLMTKTCFSCRRPFLTKTTYCNSVLEKYFCDSSIKPLIAKECRKCYLILVSPHCEKNHTQKVCRWGLFCKKCKKYTYHSKFTPQEKIEEKHECGKKICYFCGESGILTTKNHLCRIQLPTRDKIYTNMAFIDLQLTGSSPAICQDCYKDDSATCASCHKNKHQIPIMATLLIEAKRRGFFDQYIFFPDRSSRKKTYFTFPYLSNDLEIPIATTAPKTKFGKMQKKRLSEETFSDADSILNFVFHFFNKKNLRNFTVLVNDSDHNILSIIVEFLFLHGFFPQVIGSPTIFCVNIPSLSIRFINSENYIDECFEDQVTKTNYKPVYFPLKWRHLSNLHYCGATPDISHYYNFNDSDKTIQQKKDFIKSEKFPWSFAERLASYSDFVVKVTAYNCLDFLKNALQCQSLIQSWFDDSNICPPVHPFNAPLCTRAGYAYKLLCIFCEDMKNLCIVLPPISMQSSAGELEYCFYKIWETGSEAKNCQHAWSKFGQKHFPEAVPDLMINNVCYFWNGCMIHGHSEKICLFKQKRGKRKRNMFGETFENAFANYERKAKRLKSNHPHLQLEEMWQCTWQKARKENPKVSFFLQNIYKNPPTYRLDARTAGEREKT